MIIYEDADIYIETEKSEIPWLKIFPKKEYKELTDVPTLVRNKLWDVYIIIEEEMLKYYKPTKVNMASFGNVLPQVHIHVMARFKEDSYFPNPMWGEKVRDANLSLPDEKEFHKILFNALTQ